MVDRRQHPPDPRALRAHQHIDPERPLQQLRPRVLPPSNSADIETMEGAAVAYVCRQLEVPLLQVRAISNWTGDRGRGECNLGVALELVQRAVRRLLRGKA